MKKINQRLLAIGILSISAILLISGLAKPIDALTATTSSLGVASTYGVLADTYVNLTAGTTIKGDIGFTTGPAVVPLGIHENYGSDAPYAAAGSDQTTALAELASEPCTFTFGSTDPMVNLSTDVSHGIVGVYTPGVYCISGAMNVGEELTLSGSGRYIFRSTGELTSTNKSVITLSGASPCDVFWTPQGATTLGVGSTFVGTVIDAAGITVGTHTDWSGRALAFGGTITTETDEIAVPNCAFYQVGLHVITLVVNGSTGTAAASDFNIYVKKSSVNVSGSPTVGIAAPGTSYSLPSGTYVISEDANNTYTQSFSGDCDANGSVTLFPGQNKTCTIINTTIPLPVPIVPPANGGGGTGGSSTPHIVPLIGIMKVPNLLTIPVASGAVTYNYTVWNVGRQKPLIDITVTDDKCSPVVFRSGDLNNNAKLDADENWEYDCSMILNQTTTNTSIATGYSDDSYHEAAIATALVTVVVGAPIEPPLINIISLPNRFTPFPFGGGDVEFTYIVTNPGVVAMHSVQVTDDKCATVSGPTDDTNGNNLLDPGEAWVYTCQTKILASTRSVARAEGRANGFIALGYAFANVLVASPGFPNTGVTPYNQQ